MTVSFTVAWHHYSTLSKTKKITLFKLFPRFFAFFSKKIRIYTKETYKPLFLLETCTASSFHYGTAKKNQIGNCQEGLLPAFLIDFLREAHRWQKKTLQKSQLEIRTKSGRFQTCVTFQRKTLSLFRIKMLEKNAPVPEPAELFPRPDFQECKIKPLRLRSFYLTKSLRCKLSYQLQFPLEACAASSFHYGTA